ncbi:MAG TPA: CBS domain-containing protein [Candidatus Bathyarchaeia archaeon]|nr:CBS domain-containing protein [Candidatus Bathyarchaeia archaeon]
MVESMTEKAMKVRDVMARNPINIDPEAAVGTALDVMRTKHVRHLPVVDEAGTLVGIVTDRDLRHAALAPSMREYLSVRAHRRARQLCETLTDLRVRDVMTWAVVTTGPEVPLLSAALIMFESRVGSLPVLAAGRLVGLLTEQDLLKALMLQGKVAQFREA